MAILQRTLHIDMCMVGLGSDVMRSCLFMVIFQLTLPSRAMPFIKFCKITAVSVVVLLSICFNNWSARIVRADNPLTSSS